MFSIESASADPTRLLPLGVILDDTFEIRALLGEGGMGQVFEAYDRRLGRKVAVKVCFPLDVGSPLTHEAHALAALRHASFPTVFHLGRVQGLDYLVMELVTGESLAQRLDRLPDRMLPIDEALDLLLAVTRALAAAHGAGLSHRDVKPANVMLSATDRVVLMDFGLHSPHFERFNGLVSGSPAYMAPELIRGEVAPGAGGAVDLYALGCLAYEMLTGAAPFESEHLLEIFDGHLNAAPPHLSTRRDDVPPELERLVFELLSKAPGDRPEGAELLAWQLDAIRRGRSTPPKQTSTPVPRIRSSRPQIAIVEDDSSTRQSLVAIARAALPNGHVRAYRDAETGLRQMLESPADIVLVGLRLPGMSGVELVSALRGHASTAASVVVALSASPTDKEQATPLAADGEYVMSKGPELARRLPALLRKLAV